MKKIYLLLFLLLVACSPAATQEVEDESAAPAATAAVEPTATTRPRATTAESEATTDESEAAPASVAAASISPATSVVEASVIRDRDWVIGAQEPSITIIEYGDFQ